MFSSLLGVFIIIVGLAFVAVGTGRHPMIDSEFLSVYGIYAGVAVIAVGVLIGKYWRLKVPVKDAYHPEAVEAAAIPEAPAAPAAIKEQPRPVEPLHATAEIEGQRRKQTPRKLEKRSFSPNLTELRTREKDGRALPAVGPGH